MSMAKSFPMSFLELDIPFKFPLIINLFVKVFKVKAQLTQNAHFIGTQISMIQIEKEQKTKTKIISLLTYNFCFPNKVKEVHFKIKKKNLSSEFCNLQTCGC